MNGPNIITFERQVFRIKNKNRLILVHLAGADVQELIETFRVIMILRLQNRARQIKQKFPPKQKNNIRTICFNIFIFCGTDLFSN